MQVGACAESAGRLGDERAARYPAYVGGQGVAEKDVEEWGDAGGERHDGERVAESGLSKEPDAQQAAGDEAEDAHRSLYIAKLLRRQCQSAAASQVEHEQDGDGCEQRTGQQEHAQEKDARPRTRGSDEVGAGVEAGVEHVSHSYLPFSAVGAPLRCHEDVPQQHDGEDGAEAVACRAPRTAYVSVHHLQVAAYHHYDAQHHQHGQQVERQLEEAEGRGAVVFDGLQAELVDGDVVKNVREGHHPEAREAAFLPPRAFQSVRHACHGEDGQRF